MTEKKSPVYQAPDGVVGRPPAFERKMNDNMKIVFGDEVGQEVLDYLTSITLNYVCGPQATDGQIRHLEGQRYLVSIIKRRIQDANNNLPKVPKPTEDNP